MEIVGVDPKIMANYVATANNPKYNGDYTVINSKFPELKGYDPQLLADYVATANNPKYNGDYAVINSKFPELFEDNSTPATTGQKKNISTPTQGQVQTTQPVQQSDVPEKPTTPNYMGDIFNSASTLSNIAKDESGVDFNKPTIERTGYKMFDPVGKTAVESIPKPIKSDKPKTEKVVVSDIGGVKTYSKIEAPVTQKQIETKPDDTIRVDGTKKGEGYFGEIEILAGDQKGKKMTELSAGFEIDGKEVEMPIINPLLTRSEIEYLQAGKEPTQEMYDKAYKWGMSRIEQGKSPFAEEAEKIELGKYDFESIKDTNVIDNLEIAKLATDEDNIQVLTDQPNPYSVVDNRYEIYEQKKAIRDAINEETDNYIKQTGGTISQYFQWQEYLAKQDVTNLTEEEYAKLHEKFIKSKEEDTGISGTLGTVALILNPFLAIGADLVFRSDSPDTQYSLQSLGRIQDNAAILGSLADLITGTFTLTREGEYNPLKSASQIKQSRTNYLQRFDTNLWQRATEFGAGMMTEMPIFSGMGTISSKAVSGLENMGWRLFNMSVGSGIKPIMARNVVEKTLAEKILQASMRSGVTTGLTIGQYGAASQLSREIIDNPADFFNTGYINVINSGVQSAETGFAAGFAGGFYSTMFNKFKLNSLNKMLTSPKGINNLQKAKYISTNIGGNLVGTAVESSIFWSMGDKEKTAETWLEEFALFQIGLKLPHMKASDFKFDVAKGYESLGYVAPNFSKEKAWDGVKFKTSELKSLGVSNKEVLKAAINDNAKIVDKILSDKNIALETKLKVLYANEGVVPNINLTAEKVIVEPFKSGFEVKYFDKDGTLLSSAEHTNSKEANVEAEAAAYRLKEQSVFKKMNELSASEIVEFNTSATFDKAKLVDAFNTPIEKRTTEQTKIVSDVEKLLDTIASKREKIEPKKEETKPVEVKEETITLNDKEYTVTETADKTTIMVKDAYGKKEPVRNTDIEKEVLAEYNKDKATEKTPEKETKDLDFAKEVAVDVTKTNTKQKEEQLRKQKEAEAEIELDKLVEKKTDEVMNDIKADYDGTIKLGNKTFLIKKKSGRKLEVFVTNENGNLIPIDDAAALSFVNKNQDITPMSKSFIKKVKQAAIDKFLSENEAIVDVAYKEIENYRAEQYDLIQKRIESEVMQETSKYQAERDKLYNEGKLKTQEEVVIPENIEKHKSNFIGDLNKTKDIDKSLAEIRKEKWFKELNGDSQDVVHAMLRDLGEKHLKTVGKQAKMTKEEMSPASQEKFDISFRTYLKDMEAAVNKAVKIGMSQTKKAVKDLKKYTEEDFKTFINDIRKAHTEVSKYLTPAENKSILTQIEAGVKADTKARAKSFKQILRILETADIRLMDTEIKTMDKTVEKVFDTERIDKQRAQKEAKTTTEYIDFTKQVKDKAVQEPEKIQERLEELYDVIASSSNKIEVEAAKSEIEALLYAQDISVLNQLKNEFYDANSSYTDKLIAFNEMNDAYSKFMSKDPIGTYKKAYKERMATLEAERKIIQETNDIFKKSGLTPAELSKREKLAETYEKIVNSEATREEYLQEAIKDVDSIPNLSDKQKRRIKNKIESKLLKNKKAKNNDAQTDADAISEIYNVENPIKGEQNLKNKSSINVIQKGTIQFENLKGLLEILGGKNREVLEKGRELNEMADKAALKFDKLSRQQDRELDNLERLIESDNDIRQYIGEENLKLGVKEPIMSVEKLDKDGNVIEKSKAVADFDKMSYSQIMYLNQLLKTKSNIDILSKEYTPESIDALQRHCKDIVNNNPKLKEISDYIFNDLQNSIHKINNEQYKKENGVELDMFEDYVARYAIRNETRGTKSDKKGSLKPSATRIRKGARAIESKVNIVQAITEAYTDAVKYNAFSDVNMYWNRTLRNESVKTAIKTQVANGTTLIKALEKMYEAYPEGQRLDDIKLAKFVQNVVVSKLAFNVSLAPKQAIGAFNVYVDYAKALGEKGVNPMLAEAMFAKNMISPKGWTEFARAMQESDPIKQRFHENGIDPSIANYISNGVIDTAIRIGKGKNYAPSASYLKFQKAIRAAKEVQMLPVKLGDFAALVGTKPLFDLYYKDALKTMSPKEARIEAMDKAYSAFARSNQSVWSHNMSPFQLSSTGKFFAYYTSPIQMGQQFRSAARTLVNESSTKRERVDAVRGVAYYGAIQTAIFGIAGAASNGLIKWILKQAGQAMGYNTDPEDSWSDLEKFFNLPEEKKDMIGKIMQNQGITVGVPILDEITKMIGGAIQEDPYYKQDLVTTLAAIEDITELSTTVIKAASEKGEYKNWSQSEKKKLWKLAFTSVDGATGFGTGTLQRYGRFVLGLDILDAAEKDSTKTDSKITTDETKTTDSKVALPDTKPLK